MHRVVMTLWLHALLGYTEGTIMNTMDQSEKVAESYLRYRGHDNIQFEPDGNRTPDFLVDNNIAVEVRRLNQNHDFGRGRRGLEAQVSPHFY